MIAYTYFICTSCNSPIEKVQDKIRNSNAVTYLSGPACRAPDLLKFRSFDGGTQIQSTCMQVPVISIVLDQAQPAKNHYLRSPCNPPSFSPRYRSISIHTPYRICGMSLDYQQAPLQTILEYKLGDITPHSHTQSNLG